MSLATSPSYIALDVLNERWLPFYAKGGFDRCLAIVDEEVAAKAAPSLAPLWACIEPCDRLVIPGGEEVKSLTHVGETIDWLLARSATRSTLLVAEEEPCSTFWDSLPLYIREVYLVSMCLPLSWP